MKRTIYLLLFIGGLCTPKAQTQIDHWETIVYAGDNWRYRSGTSEPPTNWRSISFNDASWLEGAGGIGYGDGDDETTISPTASLYMRHQFTVIDKSKITELLFHADYDDGFVAYLNGVEIARANLEGNPPAYDASAADYREAQLYQGGSPEAFYLDAEVLEDLLQEGANLLAIQTHNFDGVVSSDMTALYWLSVAIIDSSTDYGPVPDWFPVFDFESPLPILKIDTGGEYIPDEPKINGTMGIIWNEDGSPNESDAEANEFFGPIAIERRGQTSLTLFPKNGFAIETRDENGEDLDVSFLNFPEEEDWILHGPYSDKSLLRNVVSMQIARSMGQYASRTRLVELFVNDRYEGVYVLMERIKRDENRVDIANLRQEDIAGDELTGGYVFKIDKGPADWISQFDIFNNPERKLRFQYVSPNRDNIQPEQEAYIQSYVDSFERAMLVPDATYGGKRYDEYADLESFADHFIISELTKNVDAYRISSYYYKDKDSNGGLLKAGPAWDFNLAFGNANYCEVDSEVGWIYQEHCDLGNPFWWENMLGDPTFTNTLHCRWLSLREGPLHRDSIFNFIDEKANLLDPVIGRNFQRWPVLNQYVWPNVVVTGSYAEEIDYLKSFISARLAWMDENMFGMCTVNTTQVLPDVSEFTISPNPASQNISIVFEQAIRGPIELKAFDLLGREIWSAAQMSNGPSLQVNTKEWKVSPGIYFLKITVDGYSFGSQKLILK